MEMLRDQFYNMIKDKKIITFFTTLVNANCLIYFIFSKYFTNNANNITELFSSSHHIAMIVLAICDLVLCSGFVNLYVKSKSNNSFHRNETIQSTIDTARMLKEFHEGNILSSGIYNFNYVTKIEKDVIQGDELWCITGDLEEDSKNKKLIEVIKNNLKKGIYYRYFITKTGNEISAKARLGRQMLLEAIEPKYRKRLFFYEIDAELIAPDIDIMIYKANDINERIGFVCVEIGDEEDTYIYQKVDRVILQGICDKLNTYNFFKKHTKILSIVAHNLKKLLKLFVEHFSFLYLIASTGGLTLLSFSKIVSLTSAILFLFPAIIEFSVTIALVMSILNIISQYNESLADSVEGERILSEYVNIQEIQDITQKLKEKDWENLKEQKGLGYADQILEIDDACSSIWILSNLSHDIANKDFYNWLTKNLDLHSNTKCYILYTKDTAAVGRSKKITGLKNKYSNRINIYPVEDISAHYIWSETYGIVFFDNGDQKHVVYISLGNGNNAFYKKVDTTEMEDSSLLGRLADIAGVELLA